MLQNIKPQPKSSKSKDGSLSLKEKSLAKGLLLMGYRAQDITYVMNQGRATTVNQARVSEVGKNAAIPPAGIKSVQQYLKIQNSYDPKTLLNPYKDARLIRAREAMLSAVQVFNNPTIIFKAENFCVLANIAWTYLLHEKLERTKTGSSKLFDGNSVTVSGTLGKQVCPIKDKAVEENLRKIIEVRDAVEHTFFVGGEVCFGALFQACCINFEKYMTEWFGAHLSLTNELSLALQFGRLAKEQVVTLESSNFPEKIKAINLSIQSNEYVNNNGFQLSVYYSIEATSKTNSDLHKLVASGQDNYPQNTVIKKVNYKRLSQSQVVTILNDKGFTKFTSWEHQKFWQAKWPTAAKRAKDAGEYGEIILTNQWVWFMETWLPELLKYCNENGEIFK